MHGLDTVDIALTWLRGGEQRTSGEHGEEGLVFLTELKVKQTWTEPQ